MTFFSKGDLTDWSQWSTCSSTCKTISDGPYQYRNRSCVGYSTWDVPCNGSNLTDQQFCNQNVSCLGFSCATANFFISGNQWSDQLSNKSSVEYKNLSNQLCDQFQKKFSSEKFTNELYFQDVQFYRNTNIGVIVRFTYKAQIENTIENCKKLVNFKLGSNFIDVSIKPCECCINQTVGEENLRGVYMFPFTIANRTFTKMCAYDSSITFETQCMINNATYLPELVLASLDSCPSYSPTTYQLNNTANLNVTIENILNVTMKLNSILQNGYLTSSYDIKLVSTILKNIISVNGSSEIVTNGILSSINSLLSLNLSLIQSANQIYNSSTEFLFLSDDLGKQQSNNVSISFKNLGLTSYSIKPNGKPVYVYSSEHNDNIGVNISSGDFNDELEKFNDYIVLPSKLFNSGNKIQIYSYIYKDSSFFTEVNKTIESLILSASLNGIDVSDSSSLINIKFSKLSGVSEIEKLGSVTCSFYKVKEKT
ncbi:uncharacterized protein LOC136095602 [Hydra vulgaris]|uniref:uncharacterized protein LOC136095602 n=1 Tax=Hydra vulgaris TaxID=6087 RepID=UPI0032E9EEFD